MCGREFELVKLRQNWGVYRVYFFDDSGELASLEACWTDVEAPDPFVEVAEGKAIARLADLLALARLMAELKAEAVKQLMPPL